MSGPSFLFRMQQTFNTLLHTPMLPPPAGPTTVEMNTIDEDNVATQLPRNPNQVPSALQRPARNVRVDEPAFPAPPHFRGAYSLQSYANSSAPQSPVSPSSPSSQAPSATSSFEIDADDAPAVREMLAAATRDSL